MKDVSLGERARCSGNLQWSADNNFPMSDIRAAVEVLSGYSAHADQAGLLEWLFKRDQGNDQGNQKLAASTAFIQHSTDSKRRALKDAATQRAQQIREALSIILPECPHMWFDLDRGGALLNKEQRRRELIRESERIQRELDEDTD